MDWGWVAQRTIELTIQNVGRLKDSAYRFLSAHPVESGLGFLFLGAVAFAFVRRRGRTSSHNPQR